MHFYLNLCSALLLLLAPALASAGEPQTHGATNPSCDNPVVFIDAGHGGLNIGAIGVDNLREKEVTLDVSLRLETLLKKKGSWRSTLSRHNDSFVGLRERTRMANDAGAHVFLSIHANANQSSAPKGVEVYLLSAGAANEEGMDLVIREEGPQQHLHHEAPGLGSVLYGLRLAGAQRESASLAQVVLDTLTASTKAPDRGVRQASFAVLKEAQMPALVVEIGYLTNPEEARLLAKAAYRQQIAEGLFLALEQWKVRGLQNCGIDSPAKNIRQISDASLR